MMIIKIYCYIIFNIQDNIRFVTITRNYGKSGTVESTT